MNKIDTGSSAVLSMALTVVFMLAASGCSDRTADTGLATGGDPMRGQALISSYGCAACHSVAGVKDAVGTVGPPLGNIGERAYIAGILTNTPAHMIKWIMDPGEISPKTAMPDLNVSEADARDIAAYLYTR